MKRPTRDNWIYLSYRRGDARWAGQLHEALTNRFGGTAVFSDVASIGIGQDFRETLFDAVRQAEIVLALIGPAWMDGIDEPSDFVRLELAEALRRNETVIPVLLGDTPMPADEELPRELRELTTFQAVRVSNERFGRDLAGLVSRLELGTSFEESSARKSPRRKAVPTSRQKRAVRRAPDRQAAEQLQREAELEEWEGLREDGTAADLRDHIARYPGGRTEPWARDLLARRAWEELDHDADTSDLEAYIAENPTSPHIVEAKQRLAALSGEGEENASSAPSRSGVFISYRRRDARLWALLLYHQIAERIGRDQVFLDSVNIPVGADYEEYIRRELPGYGVAIVLLGAGWRGERDDGSPRIEEADDLFRIEIELALQQKLSVMPVVVEGTSASEVRQGLPGSIAELGNRNMYELAAARFEQESPRLLTAIEQHHALVGVDATPHGTLFAGSGFTADNRTMLDNVDRLIQTKLDRAVSRFLVGGLLLAALTAVMVIGSVWFVVGAARF
ncbi:MAG: toll/interleukin-1 receptor domain-containing protein [Myxococcota bacterium]